VQQLPDVLKRYEIIGSARMMAETGCAAVKVGGGAVMAGIIHFLTSRGVPVMAHIGLPPQTVNALRG
jgi:3-methyl-2-oxobutanoate hydroxymethyltransferase